MLYNPLRSIGVVKAQLANDILRVADDDKVGSVRYRKDQGRTHDR